MHQFHHVHVHILRRERPVLHPVPFGSGIDELPPAAVNPHFAQFDATQNHGREGVVQPIVVQRNDVRDVVLWRQNIEGDRRRTHTPLRAGNFHGIGHLARFVGLRGQDQSGFAFDHGTVLRPDNGGTRQVGHGGGGQIDGCALINLTVLVVARQVHIEGTTDGHVDGCFVGQAGAVGEEDHQIVHARVEIEVERGFGADHVAVQRPGVFLRGGLSVDGSFGDKVQRFVAANDGGGRHRHLHLTHHNEFEGTRHRFAVTVLHRDGVGLARCGRDRRGGAIRLIEGGVGTGPGVGPVHVRIGVERHHIAGADERHSGKAERRGREHLHGDRRHQRTTVEIRRHRVGRRAVRRGGGVRAIGATQSLAHPFDVVRAVGQVEVEFHTSAGTERIDRVDGQRVDLNDIDGRRHFFATKAVGTQAGVHHGIARSHHRIE